MKKALQIILLAPSPNQTLSEGAMADTAARFSFAPILKKMRHGVSIDRSETPKEPTRSFLDIDPDSPLQAWIDAKMPVHTILLENENELEEIMERFDKKNVVYDGFSTKVARGIGIEPMWEEEAREVLS